MEYDIQGNAVYFENNLIGYCENHLLSLAPAISAQEWTKVKEILLDSVDFNGKLSRKDTGFHHSYEVIDGVPYRISHSLTGISDIQDKIPKEEEVKQGYAYRGYLGDGRFSNAKIITSESGQQYALRITGLTSSEYEILIKKKESKEASVLREEGNFVREYFRETKTKKQWRRKRPNIQYKKILITNLLPGKCSFDFLSEHFLGESTILVYPEKRYHFALLLLMTCAKFVNSGALHRDIKPENFHIDFESLQAGLCDFEFAVYLSAEKNKFFSKKALGTLLYNAPEIIYGKESVFSEASEIFACGIILRYLFSTEKDASDFQYINDKLCPCSLELHKYDHPFLVPAEVSERALASVAERATFIEAIEYFQGRLNDILCEKQQQYEDFIEQHESGLNEASELNRAALTSKLVSLYLERASLFHLLDYNQAIVYAKKAWEIANDSNDQQAAWQAVIEYHLRFADWKWIHPNGYSEAIEIIQFGLSFLNDNLIEDATLKNVTEAKLKEKLRHYHRQKAVYHARQTDNSQVAAEYLFEASKYALDKKDSFYLSRKATKHALAAEQEINAFQGFSCDDHLVPEVIDSTQAPLVKQFSHVTSSTIEYDDVSSKASDCTAQLSHLSLGKS